VTKQPRKPARTKLFSPYNTSASSGEWVTLTVVLGSRTERVTLYIGNKHRDILTLLDAAKSRHSEEGVSWSRLIRRALVAAGLPSDNLLAAVKKNQRKSSTTLSEYIFSMIRKTLPTV
jgi:hypothetical protein